MKRYAKLTQGLGWGMVVGGKWVAPHRHCNGYLIGFRAMCKIRSNDRRQPYKREQAPPQLSVYCGGGVVRGVGVIATTAPHTQMHESSRNGVCARWARFDIASSSSSSSSQFCKSTYPLPPTNPYLYLLKLGEGENVCRLHVVAGSSQFIRASCKFPRAVDDVCRPPSFNPYPPLRTLRWASNALCVCVCLCAIIYCWGRYRAHT